MNTRNIVRWGWIVLAGAAALAGCEQRVVSAKGIGSDRYVVKPDPVPTPSTTRKKKFVPPRTTSPTSATGRTAP
ncbi:MAG: hypothetical protein IT436_11750 [Phycisphaerales bacterium]|nr:hypothetical protein [Phycisphaerales bacterium]